MDTYTLQTTLRTMLAPSVESLGLELVAVEWLGGRTGSLLRVSVDGPKGINADDCSRVSARISPLLDAEDPIPTRYNLEVSSPGIKRPIQRPEDFVRFEGYRAKVLLVDGLPRRRYTGQIMGLEDEELVMLVDGKTHHLALDTVIRTNLDLSLEEYQSLLEGRKHDQ
jgi:ribosome maturation factor RimP